MTKMTILPPLLSLFALACTGAPEGYTPLGDGDKSDEAAVNHAARSGEFITQLVSISDDCGISDALHEPEEVELVASADGEHFEYEEDGTLIACDRIDDGSYQCEIQSPAAGFGATVMTMDAKWTNEDRFEGLMAVTMDCSANMSAEFCAQLTSEFPNGLPCTISGQVIATPLLADDFAPTEGNYNLTIGEPLALSTCAQAFPVTPEQNALLTPGDTEDTIKLFDDDGGAFAAFDCDLANGAVECERTLEFDGLSITSEIVAVFSDSGTSQGSMEVTLGCVSDDQAVCDDLEANFGELPCRSVRAVAAILEEATGDQPE